MSTYNNNNVSRLTVNDNAVVSINFEEIPMDSTSVETIAATDVNENTATINGELTDLGTASTADVWFEWGEMGEGLSNVTDTLQLSETSTFDEELTGLTSETEYEFRAHASTDDGADVGDVLTFETVEFDELESDVVISSNGDDSTGDGSYSNPYFTIEHAFDNVQPGERVIARGGTYSYTSRNNLDVGVNNQGTESDPIEFRGYGNEWPVFDFSTAGHLHSGIQFHNAAWVECRNFEVTGVDDNGSEGTGIMTRGDSNDMTFDNVHCVNNHGDGFGFNDTFDVHVKNCVASDNDGYDGADGIAIRFRSPNMIIENCQIDNNGDDGIDLFFAEDPVTIRYCSLSGNTTFDVGSAAAIKLGSDNAGTGDHLVHHCAVWNNGDHGISFNRAHVGCEIYNCVGYNNDGNDFHFPDSEEYLSDSEDAHVLRNCMSVQNEVSVNDNGNDISHCTFDGTGTSVISQNDMDIRSLNTADFAMWGDEGDFLRISQESNCLDAGTDVGLEFVGSNPDIAGYEYALESQDPGVERDDLATVLDDFESYDNQTEFEASDWTNLGGVVDLATTDTLEGDRSVQVDNGNRFFTNPSITTESDTVKYSVMTEQRFDDDTNEANILLHVQDSSGSSAILDDCMRFAINSSLSAMFTQRRVGGSVDGDNISIDLDTDTIHILTVWTETDPDNEAHFEIRVYDDTKSFEDNLEDEPDESYSRNFGSDTMHSTGSLGAGTAGSNDGNSVLWDYFSSHE